MGLKHLTKNDIVGSWRAGRDSNNVTNQYLSDSGNIPTNQSPFIAPKNLDITNISSATNGIETWVAEVYVNAVLVHSETITSLTKKTTAISLNILTGDEVSLRCNGSGINRPTIEVQYITT